MMGCIPVKSIFLGKPSSRDMDRFDHSIIQVGDSCFEFYTPNEPLDHLNVSDWTFDIPFSVTLDEFFSNHKVRSFAIIQNDTVKYSFNGVSFDSESLHPSYSIAKSFTSALIGIAIEEGLIKSEKELVKDYVPELKELDHSDKLTVEHLLNHTSGLNYKLTTDATLYYGRNSLNSLKRLRFDTIPGAKQHYLNMNVQLLGIILERATNMSPSQYLQEKIWQPLGMEHSAQWMVDAQGNELPMGGLALSLHDWARLGLLYANGGRWGDKQILPASWVKESVIPDAPHLQPGDNPASYYKFGYQYQWWVPQNPDDDFMALGIWGQTIYVNPKQKVVIVKLSADMNSFSEKAELAQIEYIQALSRSLAVTH